MMNRVPRLSWHWLAIPLSAIVSLALVTRTPSADDDPEETFSWEDIERKWDGLEQDYNNLRPEYQRIVRPYVNRTIEWAALRAEFDRQANIDFERQLQANIERRKTELAELDDKLATREAKLVETETKLVETKKKLEKAEGDLAAARSDIVALKNQNSALSDENASLTTQVNDLQTENNRLKRRPNVTGTTGHLLQKGSEAVDWTKNRLGIR